MTYALTGPATANVPADFGTPDWSFMAISARFVAGTRAMHFGISDLRITDSVEKVRGVQLKIRVRVVPCQSELDVIGFGNWC